MRSIRLASCLQWWQMTMHSQLLFRRPGHRMEQRSSIEALDDISIPSSPPAQTEYFCDQCAARARRDPGGRATSKSAHLLWVLATAGAATTLTCVLGAMGSSRDATRPTTSAYHPQLAPLEAPRLQQGSRHPFLCGEWRTRRRAPLGYWVVDR